MRLKPRKRRRSPRLKKNRRGNPVYPRISRELTALFLCDIRGSQVDGVRVRLRETARGLDELSDDLLKALVYTYLPQRRGAFQPNWRKFKKTFNRAALERELRSLMKSCGRDCLLEDLIDSQALLTGLLGQYP